MKKVRRGLALLVAALVVVNSTDFSLLTVNAKEQTAQESDAQALKKTGADTESGQPSDGNGTDDGTYRDEEKNNQTDKGDGTESSSDEKKSSGDTVTGGTGGTETTEQGGSGPETPDPEENPGSGAPSGNTQKPDGSQPSGDNGTEGSTGGEGPGTETAGQNEDGVSYIVSVDFTDADLSANVTDQSVEIGATLKDVNLPDTVRAVIAGQSETEEMKVREWEIITPAGAVFDTSASEEDENVPKVGFYEFAPVIEPEEGYEWNSTVPDGYGSWDEYLENWMKISVTVGEEKEGKAVAEGGTYDISFRTVSSSQSGDLTDENGDVYATWDSSKKILTLKATGSATFNFISDSDFPNFGGAVNLAEGIGTPVINLNGGTISGSAFQTTGIFDFSNAQKVTLNVNSATALTCQTSAGLYIPEGTSVAVNGAELSIGGVNMNGLVINAGALEVAGTVKVSGVVGAVNNEGGAISVKGNLEITANTGAAVTGGSLNIGGIFLAKSLMSAIDLLENVTLTGQPCLSAKFMTTPSEEVSIVNAETGAEVTKVELGTSNGTAWNFVRNLPAGTYNIVGEGNVELKYAGNPKEGGDQTSDFTVTTGISEYINIDQVLLPVFWQAHGENVTFDSAVLVGEVDTNHGGNCGNQDHTRWGFKLVGITDEDGDSVGIADAFEKGVTNDYITDGSDIIFVADTKPGSSVAGTNPAGTTFSRTLNGLKEGYTYTFLPCVETKFGWEMPVDEELEEPDTDKTEPSVDANFSVTPLYLNWPDEIELTYGEVIGDLNTAGNDAVLHPSLSMRNDNAAVTSGNLITENQAALGVAGSFYVYRGTKAEGALTEEQKSDQNQVWSADEDGSEEAYITFVPAEGNVSYSQVTQKVKVTVHKRALDVTELTNAEREYDGTTALTAADLGGIRTFVPLPHGQEDISSCTGITSQIVKDGIYITQNESKDIAGIFSQKDVGDGLDVTLNNLSVASDIAGAADNYTIASSIKLEDIGKITPREMTLIPVAETMETGESTPAFRLEIDADSPNQTYGENDSQAGVIGTPQFTVVDLPDFDPDNTYSASQTYTVQTTLQGASGNYAFTVKDGTLTVIQNSADGRYTISAVANDEGWFDEETVTITPAEDSGYDYIRIGVLGGSGAVRWGEWKTSYEYTATAENLVIQLCKDDKGTDAFTSWTQPISLEIDSDDPVIEDVEYKDKSSGGAGNFVEDLINFLTFGNYYKGEVTATVEISDAISGPKSLWYQIGEAEYIEVPVTEETDGTYTASFDIPAGENSVLIEIEDHAGNRTAAFLKKNPDGGTQSDVASTLWVIDTSVPTVVVSPSGTNVTGKDNNTWYHSDVEIQVTAQDDNGLQTLYETVGDADPDGVWNALDEKADAETSEHTYTKTVSDNTVGTDGTVYTYYVTDLAGNQSPDQAATIRIDKNKPQISDLKAEPAQWFNEASKAEISFTASDAESGVYSVEIAKVKDANSSTEIATPSYINITTAQKEGGYAYTTDLEAGTYRVRVTDVSGWTTEQDVVIDKLDTSAPAIEDVSAVAPDKSGEDWNSTDVTVSVSASDPAATASSVQSGLKELQYTLDGTKWETVSWIGDKASGSITFEIAQDGQHTVRVKAVDAAGNESEEKSIVIWIDRTQPELTMSAELEENGGAYTAGTSTNKAVEFTYQIANLEEIESGVTYEIRMGGADGTWMSIEQFLAQHQSGYAWDEETHTLTVGYIPDEGGSFAVDDIFDFRVTTGSKLSEEADFGNVKVTKVQLNKPVITLEPENATGNADSTSNLNWYYGQDGILTVTVDKVTSTQTGAAAITTHYEYWEEDDEESEKRTGFLTEETFQQNFAGSGRYTFRAWATDEAGNESEVNEVTFIVDRIAPEIETVTYSKVNDTDIADALNKLSFGIFFNESVRVTVTASDDESGVSYLEYQIGGGSLTRVEPTGNTFTFDLPVNGTSGIISMKLCDAAGNVLTQNLGTDLTQKENPVWILENTAPTVTNLQVEGTAAPVDSASAPWYNHAVQVTAEVADQASGLDSVEYDLGAGAQQIGEISEDQAERTYSFAETASAEGISNIWVGATDLAGNSTAETDRAAGVIKIDTKAPEIGAVTLSTPENDWTNTSNTATFTVEDKPKTEGVTASGVASVTVTRTADGKGGAIQEPVSAVGEDGTWQFTVKKNGTYLISAVDQAGNLTTKEVTIENIDALTPAATEDGGLVIPDGIEQNDEGTYTADEVPVYIYAKDAEETTDSAESKIKEYDWYYVPSGDTGAEPVASGSRVAWNESGQNSITMNMTGTFDLTVTVRDHAGNETVFTLKDISINNGRPLLTVEATETKGGASEEYPDDTWTNADTVSYKLTLQAGADADDNVLYWAKTDDGNTTTFEGYTEIEKYADSIGASWDEETKTFTVSKEGNQEIIFCVTNGAQQNPSAVPRTCKIDRTSPEKTEAEASGTKEEASNDWFQNKWPEITFGQLDDADFTENTAPVVIEYKVWKTDGQEPDEWKETKGSASAETILQNAVTEDGKYTFRWRVTDEAGNTSDDAQAPGQQTLEIWVDSTDPVKGEIIVEPKDTGKLAEIINNIFGNFSNQTVVVTVQASDATSGLRELKYEIEDGTTGTARFDGNGTASFEIDPSQGLYSKEIRLAYVDNAGNVTDYAAIEQGDTPSVDWTIEGQAPVLSQFEVVGGTAGQDGWYTSEVTLGVTVGDAGGLAWVAVSKSQGGQTAVADWYEWNADLTSSGQSLPVQHTANVTTEESEQGTITYTLKAKDIAGNEITTDAPVTVKIDTVAPVISTPELTSTDVAEADEWTNQDRVYQFTITEVTSGINEDSVSVSGPDGKTYEAEKVDGTENTWQFHAPENGEYIVSAADHAGNQAETASVTAERIDKHLPENPYVEVIPVKKEGQEWYTQSDNAYVVLRPVRQDADESENHTYYTLQKEGDAGEPVQTEITDNYPTQVLDSGIWTLRVWSEDEAGNKCANPYKEEIKVDNELPEIGDGITFKDRNNTDIVQLINWLTFGNFFNKEVVVTVPVSDGVSHLKSFYYQIGDDEPVEVPIENAPEEETVTFTLPVQTTDIEQKEVLIWAEDIAGNKSDANERRLVGEGSSANWMIEQEGPAVAVEVKDGSSLNGDTGWYQQHITLKGTAQDTDSGLNQVIWKKTTQADESAAGVNKDVTELDLATAENKSWILDERSFDLDLEDGVHTVFLQAMDNSTNISKTQEVVYKVDSTKPTLEATGFQGDDPVNERQFIRITADDETSRLMTGSLKITYVTTTGEKGELERTGIQQGGYTVLPSGKEAIFWADKDATYTISVKDNAGNETIITGKNHLVAQIQGKEYVKVNGKDGVTGLEASPWYNDFPEVTITTPEISQETGGINVYTAWYLADPSEGELLAGGEDDGLLVKDASNPNGIGYNPKITGTDEIGLIKNESNVIGHTETASVPEEYFTDVDMDGNWILYAQSVDEAKNVGVMSKYYISMDRGKPTISTPTIEDEGQWTTEKQITFTVTDPYENNAPNNRDSISGILGKDRVTILCPNGELYDDFAGPMDKVSATFDSFTATENGTYTIIAKDNVNAYNSDGTRQEPNETQLTFTVTHIDTETPDNAAVTTNPAAPTGNAVEGADGYNWYIGARPDIVITAPVQPTENPDPDKGTGDSLITTCYTITCDGVEMVGETEINPDDAQKVVYEPQQDGKWEVTTWTRDTAGNESEPETTVFYIDQEAPDIVTDDIQIDRINEGGIQSIINKLSFGIFFKEGIKVTVPVKEPTDSESGVAALYYQLSDGTVEQAASFEKTENGVSYYSFTIREEYAGTITLITEDKAGNKDNSVKMTGDMAEGDGPGTSDQWVIDLTDPQITVTPDHKVNEYGWYDDSLELTVTVNGGISGVHEVTWTSQYEDGETNEQTPILNSNEVTSIQKEITDTVQLGQNNDGKYTVVFDAKDNALREDTTGELVYQIDSTAPTGNIISNPDEWVLEKTIQFNVKDATSGIRKDSIQVALNGEPVMIETTADSIISAPAEKLSEVAEGYDCTFTAVENGTYTVTALDAAGHEVTFEIKVTKVDSEKPEAPTVKVNDSETIQTWYNGSDYPEVSGVKNAQDDVPNNVAPVTTMYKLWNSEVSPAEPTDGEELIAAGNEHITGTAQTPDTDGEWTVILWNVDGAGNESGRVTKTFRVDTIRPVIHDETVQPGEDDPYVQSIDVKFTLEDPQKSGDGHGAPSGVDTDTLEVTFTPRGTTDVQPVDASQIQGPDADGVYTIHAALNGTYTIHVKDKAGNPAVAEEITLTKISSVSPENAEISFDGTEGNPVADADGHGWYLYKMHEDDQQAGVKVIFTTGAPPEGNDTVRVDVKYLIWEDGEDRPDESGAETVPTYGKDQKVETFITEGGVWNIRYWTVSESGLSSPAGETKVYYDPEDTTIVENEIRYTTENDEPLANLINWLTFGTFFNEQVKVTVPLKDAYSGAAAMTYQIGNAAPRTTTVQKDSAGQSYAEFRIPMDTKGYIRLTVTDAAGNTTEEYTLKSIRTGQETIWTIENQLPTAESVNPKLQDSDITVIEVEGVTGEPLSAVDLKFSERVQWMEGGRVTISTATETYTYTYSSTDADGTADQIPLEEDETKASEATIPLEKFVNENGEPLELELDQTYTMVVEQGAFMDYATNVNERTLLSAFQTQKSASLPPEMLQPVLDLELDVDAPESITMNPDFDPETTGYVIVVDEEAMAGDAIAEDIGFVPTLRDDAEVISAVLTDMLGSPVLDEDGNAISYAINGDGTFTVPKEDIRANENYFVRMTASRYGIETVYNFMISTSAYSEVVTLATSGMTKVEAEGLSGVADFDSLLQGGKKLIIQLIASIPREETAEKSLEAVKAAAGGKKGYYSLDLEINQFLSDGVNTVIEETDNPVTITFTLPAELRGKDTYEVYRNHDGVVTRLKCTLSADGTKLTFASDKFSFFTIAYTPYEEEGPEIEYVEVPGDRVYIDRPGDTAPGSHTASAGGVRTTTAGEMSARAAEAAEAAEIAAQQRELEEQESAQGGEGGTEAVSEDDLKSMFPQGLALVNLAVMVVSMLLTEYSYCRQKKIRKLIGSGLSILLILLFFLTQPLKGLIGMVDEWTIAFIIIGVIHLIATAIPTRRDDEDDGDHGESDSKDSSETEDALRV